MTVTSEERGIFATLDPQGTGSIKVETLITYLKSDASTADWAEWQADFADRDANGIITLEEFARLHRSKDGS